MLQVRHTETLCDPLYDCKSLTVQSHVPHLKVVVMNTVVVSYSYATAAMSKPQPFYTKYVFPPASNLDEEAILICTKQILADRKSSHKMNPVYFQNETPNDVTRLNMIKTSKNNTPHRYIISPYS